MRCLDCDSVAGPDHRTDYCPVCGSDYVTFDAVAARPNAREMWDDDDFETWDDDWDHGRWEPDPSEADLYDPPERVARLRSNPRGDRPAGTVPTRLTTRTMRILIWLATAAVLSIAFGYVMLFESLAERI